MATEARLLAVQVISSEIGSSSMAENIEDRMTMAGLSARKLSEFIRLAYRCCAISCCIACQAIDVRECTLGGALKEVYDRVRLLVPTMGVGDSPPLTLEHLVEALQRDGVLLGGGGGGGGGVSKL